MGFLIFLGGIVYLIVAAIIASEFQSIATEKGYDVTRYFWFTFLFGVLGMLMVIALPDKKARPKEETVEVVKKFDSDELPDL